MIRPKLFRDQLICRKKILTAFKTDKKVLFVLPTGGGKTYIACDFIDLLAKHDKRIYFIAHRDNILDQIEESLKEFNLEYGRVRSGKSQLNHYKIQVCSVRTLINRLDSLPTPDMIVIDEAHHTPAGSWLKVINHWSKTRLLGVTATPRRRDGKGLGDYFTKMVVGDTVRALINKKRLSDYDYYVPTTNLDLSDVSMSMGDYKQNQAEEALEKSTIIGDAVTQYKKICNHAPAVAFCISIKHAEHVASQFRANGIKAIALHSKMTKQEIKNAIKGLGNGTYEVVSSVDIISEGTDIPVIKCAMLLRPTYSESLFLQQVGRALRVYPGKGNAVILDFVNNLAVHGLPDKERLWSLYTPKTKARKGAVELAPDKYVTCPICFKIDIKCAKCSNCGYVFTDNERKIETINGNLIKLSKEEEEKKKQEEEIKKYEKKLKLWSCKTLSEFLEFAKSQNYKKGWAYRKWDMYCEKHNLDSKGNKLDVEPSGLPYIKASADDLAYQCGLDI